MQKSRKEALDEIKKLGYISSGSAGIFINNFQCLMKGIAYKRAMNYYSTEYFLEQIRKDNGINAYKMALTSVRLHIDYYASLGKGKQVAIGKLIDECSLKFGLSQDFDLYPEIVESVTEFSEGAVKKVTVNAYERSYAARLACIESQGVRCKVCDISFEEFYGDIGVGFIHVHHIVDIAIVKSEYQINPLRDLVPVCPNCHAMLHRTKPAMSVAELKAKIQSVKS